MFEIGTVINTEAGSKYLRHFDIGRCTLKADAATLSINCYAEDKARLEELKGVIKSHFDRFARREHQVLDWLQI